MTLQTVVALVNLLIAALTVGATVISWYRGGAVARFINNIGQIGDVESGIRSLRERSDNAETLLMALALSNKKIDSEKAMEMMGMKTEYRKLLKDADELEQDDDGGGSGGENKDDVLDP